MEVVFNFPKTMKSYLPHLVIITSLCLGSISCNSPVTETEAKHQEVIENITQDINPHIKNKIAPEITVRITGAENNGSGVIIGKQDNDKTYLILTNNHVIRGGETFTIHTHDGKTHQANLIENNIETNDDLALLEFNSENSYKIASLNSAAIPRVEQTILAIGYAAETGELVTQAGIIERVPSKSFKEGYQIGYTSKILQGMSGGAIINTNGEVIGINGKTAFPIVNTVYDYQDGTKPTPEKIEQLRQLSWGIALNRLLSQANPKIITAYNLPLPSTVATISNPELTGWLAELEDKAKQITVRIDSSSGANGSGIIVAKEGKTYAVLTADHVICEKDKETRDCIDYTYEIVTPDGKKYPLDSSSFKRQEGVDLAVVRFTSKKKYQVAQLANYPITRYDAVFVAGYPQSRNNSTAQWLFSLGFGLDREQGLLQVTDNSLSIDTSGSISSQGSLAGGYEMVYTSITYGGMSGGAVLDRDGRVIGIHGLAEGEAALDSQSGSVTKVQLGYSLGIPINTFIGLADRFEITATLPIQNNQPRELKPAKIEVLKAAFFKTEIPQGNATAERWLERGNQLWRLDRYDEAIQAFDQAIALNPDFIHLAYYGKGKVLGYGRKYEAALASIEQATETEPNFTTAFLIKSSFLSKLNRFDEALVAIDKAISLQQDNANLYNQQGAILSSVERYSEAEAAYKQAIKFSPRSIFYYNRGIVYDNQGRKDLALVDYNRAIYLNPNDAQAHNNRGLLNFNQGKSELALNDYNLAILLNPRDPDAYYNRGNLYKDLEETDLALNDYNSVILLDPKYAKAYNNRGNLYKDLEETDLALADFNQAIDLNPEFTEPYNNRGVLYAKLGKTELALADFNQAILMAPKDADAYINRGLLYTKLGKTELALDDYNKSLTINPELAEAYYNRGALYARLEELELALADYNKAIDLNPELVEVYINRGALYAKLGELELALTDYNIAIDLDPESAEAYYNRGLLYYEQGELELALADYSKAIDLNPKYAAAYNNRGVIYKDQRQLELALIDYNIAIDLNPELTEAYNNRGLLYNIQGERELALADYSKVISLTPKDTSAYNNRGVIYAMRRELELAEADFKQAILIDPKYAEAYANLGFAYLQIGNIKSAQTNLQEAQQLFLSQGNPVSAQQVDFFLRQLPQGFSE